MKSTMTMLTYDHPYLHINRFRTQQLIMRKQSFLGDVSLKKITVLKSFTYFSLKGTAAKAVGLK